MIFETSIFMFFIMLKLKVNIKMTTNDLGDYFMLKIKVMDNSINSKNRNN